MRLIEMTAPYMLVTAEFEGMTVEARWAFGGYVNYFVDGREVACAWQTVVIDRDTFSDFVRGNLPEVLGDPDDDEV
jgi:hypothetical protein